MGIESNLNETQVEMVVNLHYKENTTRHKICYPVICIYKCAGIYVYEKLELDRNQY